jgi:putative MATE family efflux protein
MSEGAAGPAGAAGSRGAPRMRGDLTQGPIARTLLMFALPTLGSNVLQSLNGSINSIFVGRFLGEDALAATANGNILMFMLMAFVFGFSMAGTILIGQAFGRRNINEARRVLGTTVGAFLPLVVLISVLGWVYAPDLLRLLSTPRASFDLALDYIRIIFIALPGGLMMAMLMMTLRGSGDAMTPFWFMLLSVILGIILNPVLILGLGPAPELGIAGSAAGTAIANYVSLAGMLVYVYARDLPLRLRGPDLRYLVPNAGLLRMIIFKGIPMGLQMIVISSSGLAMLGLVNREGVITTAAYTVTQQLWTYVQMPAMALGGAVSSMAAQNIGAGNWDRVSKATRAGVLFNLLLTGSLVILLTVAERPALELFLGSDSPALPIAEHILLVSTWGFVFFGVALVLSGTMRANGIVIAPLIMLFISMYPVRFGVVFGTDQWLGVDALWWSYPAGMVATLLMATGLYLHGGWRRKGLAPAKVDEVADEAFELTQASGEPGGSLNPRG